jgi:hypothetical protein
LPGAPLYAGDTSAPRFARLLAAITVEFGALGVALFFMISGYVIAISLDRYSRRGFIVGRFMRVLPTYAAGYLVSCVVVWAVSDPGHELIPTHVLAGMVPGLPVLVGVPAPADGIVWTLIVELVFYGGVPGRVPQPHAAPVGDSCGRPRLRRRPAQHPHAATGRIAGQRVLVPRSPGLPIHPGDACGGNALRLSSR